MAEGKFEVPVMLCWTADQSFELQPELGNEVIREFRSNSMKRVSDQVQFLLMCSIPMRVRLSRGGSKACDYRTANLEYETIGSVYRKLRERGFENTEG